MQNKASSLRKSIDAFLRERQIDAGMDQNLIKEAIHLHLLSAMSGAGILRHAIFQGGTALRLCYGGERYSEDLYFVCGKAGSYFADIEFDRLVDAALDTTRQTLKLDFDIAPDQIALKRPTHPNAIRQDTVAVAAWQIIVPVEPTPRAPKSRVKIEFANVPAYDARPTVARATQGLAAVEDVILSVESTGEILADKAVALTARPVFKFRDVWDVWYLRNRLDAKIDGNLVHQKFKDYGTTEIETKARERVEQLSLPATKNAFIAEIKRFLPAKRLSQIEETNLHHAMLAASGDLLRQAVLPS